MNKLSDYKTVCNCTAALVCALKHRDIYTQLHSQRVVELAENLGVACGLVSTDIELLKISACLHDIGKIGIPDEILLKPTKLGSKEWEIMKTHSEKGADIVRMMGISGSDSIAEAISQHHENFNGQGYPKQMSGEQISILARIITVADCYEAITVTRPYHQPRSHRLAMEILSEDSGIKTDPYVFNKFESLIKNSPHRAE